MNLEYKVSGHYFQEMKKGFYKGRISLFPDGKIVGLLEDEDYKDQGKKFVLGFYKKDFIENIYFIKTPRLDNSIKMILIYSLTKENLNSNNFDGTYKGFYIGIEPYFKGISSKALGIPEMSDTLRSIFQQKSEKKTLKKLEDLDFLPITLRYFNEEILDRLDSLPHCFRQNVELTISKI